MKRYSSYKDSGVEWIGIMPSHWKITKLKNYTSYINGYAFKSDSYVDEGVPIMRIGDIKPNIELSECKKVPFGLLNDLSAFEVKYGDVLIALTGATIGKSTIYKESTPSLLNQRVAIIRGKNSLEQRLIKYIFSLHQFKEYVRLECDGGAQENIGTSEIGEFKISLASINEQQKIVSFLDKKTQKIDTLIQHKEKKIELLKEKRTSLINHTVTKGLHSNVEMKDSGVKWIGEIPKHWERMKFKYVTRLMTCGHAATPEYVDKDEGYIFLSAQNIQNENVDLWKHNYISPELHNKLTKNHRVVRGDILQVRVGGESNVGQTAVYDRDDEISIYVSLSHIKLNDRCIPHFIKYLCNSAKYKEEATITMKRGGGVANFNVSDQERILIPVPPKTEQQEIVDYLNEHSSEIDNLIKLEEKKINLLTEYRQSLISEVVTGKIRVCEKDHSLMEQTA